MVEAGIDVIGVVSGVLGIVSFFQSLFPPSPSTINQAGSSNLRIAAGMNGKGLSEANGHIGIINLYNENQEKISYNPYEDNPFGGSESEVNSGSFTDFTLDCSGQQPTYVQIFGTGDAICIAYIAQTWPDGTQRGWSGDVGMLCDQSYWAYFNIIVSGDGHKPACTWLDRDHTNGLKAAAM